MELIYIWINEYRTYKDTGINLSDKFIVKYNQESNSILIEENKDFLKLYPDHILNINTFLGKNSSGKSNLLDLIGMKIDDRNNLNEEFEVIYKRRKPGQIGYKIPDDIEEEKKKAGYFFVYYIDREDDGVDKFCIEGNNIDLYIDLFSNKEKINTQKEHNPINYWRGKYWFAFVCTYNSNKLTYQFDVQKDGGFDEEHRKYNLTTKDKSAILLFREKYNPSYYKHSSFKSEDDYKIAIPRRIAHFDTKYLYEKIIFLIDQMKREDNELYSDTSYKLSIKYESSKTKDFGIYDIDKIENELSISEKSICKILSSYCFFFSDSIFPNEERAINKESSKELLYFAGVKKAVSNISPKGKDYRNIREYYWNVLKYIVKAFFNRGKKAESKKESNHILSSYQNLVTALEKAFIHSENKLVEIIRIKDTIDVTIYKNTDKQLITELLQATIDERIDSELSETFSVFNNFFDYRINFLSDGELAYLGMMASLDEQISLMTQMTGRVEKKEKYILLLDEPESRMHPELARTFLKTLIEFLSQYKYKTFQIILASHSPFLVSDIPKTNVFTITKDEDSHSVLSLCKLDTFSQNVHKLLSDAFFMRFTIGEYARYKVEEVKDFLNSKLYNTDYDGTMTIDEVEKIINLIGESVLKTALQGKFKKIKSDYIRPELKDAINKYDCLSFDEKKQMIAHIISSQKGGDKV